MNNQEWITVKNAARIRNCTDRTVLRLIEQKKVEAKRDGKRWLILKSSLPDDTDRTDDDMLSYLKAQLQQRDEQVKQLQEELSNVRERSDTIILALTQQNQQLLEDKRPWYQRWFRIRPLTVDLNENERATEDEYP